MAGGEKEMQGLEEERTQLAALRGDRRNEGEESGGRQETHAESVSSALESEVPKGQAA